MMSEKAEAELEHGIPRVVEDILAGGIVFPEQKSSVGNWSPEKELAAAVLTDALVEIRDYCGHPRHKKQVAEDLQWVFGDDPRWPFSFLGVCAVFDLDPGYVRGVVWHWLQDALKAADPNAKTDFYPTLLQ
jgi:hypothetical protein